MNTSSESKDKRNREKSLRLAMLRICAGRPVHVSKDRKLSITSVAEEAQVSPSLIHNRYPHIAKDIRARLAKSVGIRSARIAHVPTETGNLSEARRDLVKLASVNAGLLLALEDREAEIRALREHNIELKRKCSEYVRQLNLSRSAILPPSHSARA